jgi:hypothetical protein
VYAEFENWNQYWNLVWNEDNTLEVNLSGPWPSFTLVPIEDDEYIGVRTIQPYDTVSLKFSNNCIVVDEKPVCSE